MEKLITNLQQTYCTWNSYYMSIMKPISWKGPDLCINYIYFRYLLNFQRLPF